VGVDVAADAGLDVAPDLVADASSADLPVYSGGEQLFALQANSWALLLDDAIDCLAADGQGRVFTGRALYDGAGSRRWAAPSALSGSRECAFDKQGNVLDTGTEVTGAKGSETYKGWLRKLDGSGSQLWQLAITGLEARDVAVDTVGNSYWLGAFSGSITVAQSTLTAVGDWDAAVIKVDASGSVVWAKAWGTTGKDFPRKLVLDRSQRPLILGDFDAGLQIAGKSFVGAGRLIVRLDQAGTPLWAYELEDGNFLAIAAGEGDSIYLGGNVTAPFTRLGKITVFFPGGVVAKIVPGSEFVWAQIFGGQVLDLAVADDNTLHLTGSFPGGGPLLNRGDVDIMVGHFTSAGQILGAVSAGTVMKDGSERIVMGLAGELFVAGLVGQYTSCCQNCSMSPCNCPTACSVESIGFGVKPEVSIATSGTNGIDKSVLWKLAAPSAPVPDGGVGDGMADSMAADGAVADGAPADGGLDSARPDSAVDLSSQDGAAVDLASPDSGSPDSAVDSGSQDAATVDIAALDSASTDTSVDAAADAASDAAADDAAADSQ
jgi:hypothetical protein